MGDEERGKSAGERRTDSAEGGFSILLGEDSIRAFMSSGDFSSARELERFIDLASRVEGRLADGGKGSILAMSAGENRLSRDFAVLQIAHILAKHGREVLLVDCDFMSPGLSGLVENVEEHGFLDLLLYGSSLKTVARPTGIDGVKVIGPGSFPVSRTIPFAQKEFDKAKELLSRGHDVIIYCSTLYTDDGTVNPLASTVDSIFLSCRLEEMEEGELRKNLGDIGPDHPPVDLVCFGEGGEAMSKDAADEEEKQGEGDESSVEQGDEIYREEAPELQEDTEPEAAAIEKTAELESGTARKRGGMDLPRVITAAVVVIVAVFLVWWFIIHRTSSEKESEIKTAELVQKQRDAREQQERAREDSTGTGSPAGGPAALTGRDADSYTEEPRGGPGTGTAGESELKEEKVQAALKKKETASEPAADAGPVEKLDVSEPEKVTLAPEGSYYSVHVASFRDMGRAVAETDYLDENGYGAIVRETDVKGAIWFRVYVGEFETREEAAALRLRLLDLSRVGYARVVTLKEKD